MKLGLVFSAALLCSTGCVRTDHPFKRCESTEVTFHADTEFSDDERKDIADASREWFDATDGRADMRVVFDGDLLGHHIFRETQAERMSGKAVRVGEWNGLDIRLFPDLLPAHEFYPIVLHEFGHVLGIPGHPHPPDGVMRGEHSSFHHHLEQVDLAAYARFCSRGV